MQNIILSGICTNHDGDSDSPDLEDFDEILRISQPHEEVKVMADANQESQNLQIDSSSKILENDSKNEEDLSQKEIDKKRTADVLESQPVLNLACVDLILANIQAKHDRKPMSWAKDAKTKKVNFNRKKIAYSSVSEDREYVDREKSVENRNLLKMYNKA